MEHKIGIVMVTVNCYELSLKAFSSVKTKYPHHFVWIANGCNDETEENIKDGKATGDAGFTPIINPPTSGLSGCWNMGIKECVENDCDYILVINNDIALSPSTIDNLVERMEKGDVVMATAVNVQNSSTPEQILATEFSYQEENINEHPDFSCFMISQQTIEKVGWLDENYFVAYFEDNDYHGRIVMLGEKAITIACAPYFHYGSQTSQQNPNLRARIEEAFRRNKEYFKQKFGVYPISDAPEMLKGYYPYPYNNESRDWRDTSFNLGFDHSRMSEDKKE